MRFLFDSFVASFREGFRSGYASVIAPLAGVDARPARRGIDLEIERVRAAVERHEAEIDRLVAATPQGACCPACVHGHAFVRIVERHERARAWLGILEEKARR